MPLGSNPAFSAVRSFFGGPANLGAYVRGGAHVPNIAANANISTTVAGLRLSQFSGADNQVGATLSAARTSVTVSTANGSGGGTMTGSVGLTPGGGNGSYSMSASIISNSGVSGPSASANTTTGFAGGTIYAPPDSSNMGTLVVRYTNTTAGTSASVDVTFSLHYQNVSPPPSCVLSISHVDPNSDKRAGELTTADSLLITDPYDQDLAVLPGQVRISETHVRPCVRLEMANGTWLECSHTAPIPTFEGEYVNAIDLLGRLVPTATATQLQKQDLGEMDWSRVMQVIDIGEREVQLLFVDDRAFWASGDGKRFVLHHNSKLIV